MSKVMIKRLCIFVVFDKDAIIDKYIEYILKELRNNSDYIVVVANFEKIICGAENIINYADKIVYRKNTGYDAGAYKDILLNYIGWDNVHKYQEVILANDSFFGPLYSFQSMFDMMSNTNCDYWGITRHYGGVFSNGYAFKTHIQSYFLVFKQQIVSNSLFEKFWNEYLPVNDRYITIVSFEIGINKFLNKNGFNGMAYMDLCGLDFHDEYSINNPYALKPYELIREGHIPIIKKSALFFDNPGYTNALKALDYINENALFDIDLIKNNVLRSESKRNNATHVSISDLEKYVQNHKKIYLYGNGMWGRLFLDYFKYRGWKIAGVIVTKKNPEEDVIAFSEFRPLKTDGIIIAQGKKKNADEIYKNIIKKIKKEDIFIPCYT